MQTLITVLKVSDARTIGRILAHRYKDEHSATVQAQKQLNLLVETGKLIRGKGWYALPEYRGEYKEHDRLVTEAIARLILLKLPISVHREVSFPIGLRSDVVALIGKDGKALCVIVEVANNETPEYLNQKLLAWKNWQGANEALGQLFNTPIPHFSVIVSRNQPDDDFNQFLGGQYGKSSNDRISNSNSVYTRLDNFSVPHREPNEA